MVEAPNNSLRFFAPGGSTGQAAVDIFKGTWTSKVPGFESGNVNLFGDDRAQWALDQLGGVAGQRILELGPLEAGHTYMLDRAGAAHVTAVEAHQSSLLKCLVIKELFGLRASFEFGCFAKRLREVDERFDTVWASGVLYHSANPVELLSLIAKRTDRLYLWTHYFDAALVAQQPHLEGKFGPPEQAEFEGFAYVRHEQRYQADVERVDYCGGPERISYWLPREVVLGALRHFGFTEITIPAEHEWREFAHGPCFTLVATKG